MYGEKLIKTVGKIYGIVFCMNESFCSSFYCFNKIAKTKQQVQSFQCVK